VFINTPQRASRGAVARRCAGQPPKPVAQAAHSIGTSSPHARRIASHRAGTGSIGCDESDSASTRTLPKATRIRGCSSIAP
jgi:hypothetical protein